MVVCVKCVTRRAKSPNGGKRVEGFEDRSREPRGCGVSNRGALIQLRAKHDYVAKEGAVSVEV